MNRWTLAAVLAMCLLLLTGVSACGTDGRQEGGSPGMENSVQGGKISKLEFSLSAMHYDPNFPVNISQKSGEWFIALGAHDVVQKPFRAEDVDEINRVLLQYKVRKWDGFMGSNPPGVLDGEQFYLSIDYEDGGHIYASGSNNFPEGFHDFCMDFMKIVSPYMENEGK